MAQVVQQLDDDPRIADIYYVFNEINPKLIEDRAKCDCNKCGTGGLIIRNPTSEQVEKIISGPSQHLTTNEDVVKLRWLFIDVDTQRAEGHEHDSSTKVEKAATKEVAKTVIAHLSTLGWPNALLADSGNGYHILPKIDLFNTDINRAYVEDTLKVLSKQFSVEAAKIDSGVFNPARLTRAYGTHTRKGVETPERPHRLNRVVVPTTPIKSVSFDQITALADSAPKRTVRGDMPVLHEDFDPEDFFQHYEDQGAFTCTSYNEWQGHKVRIIDHCIISGTKHTGSKLTGFIIGDTFGYHCWSPECNDPNIGDVLKKLFEDGFKRFDKPIWIKEEETLDFKDLLVDLAENESEQYQQKTAVEPESIPPVVKDFSTFEPEEVLEIQEDAEEIEEIAKPSIVAKLEKRIEADEAQEAADMGAAPNKIIKEKPTRVGDIKPNQYAEWMMAVIFRDPKKANVDYGFYRKRFEKLFKHLTETVREAFGAMVFFERANKYLPTKEELCDYVLHSEDCEDIEPKDVVVAFIKGIIDDGTHFFDTTAKQLIIEMDFSLETAIARKAFNEQLLKKRDIEAFRTAMRKHWAATHRHNSNFEPGTWQESTEAILEAFRKNISGEGNERKFKLGFDTIDNSGMNIGLDGNHAIVLYGPASNRKTNAAMTIALNFAMQGKRGLFLAGEHLKEKINKRLTLMLSYYLRKTENNPEGIVPVIPGLPAWEGINVTATEEDLANVATVLSELKSMRVVPGYLDVQNINSITRGEEDAWGAIEDYIDSTHKKYDWDFVIIDPLDTVLPTEQGNKDQFQACSAVIDRMFDYSREFAGDRGLMLIVTAQFKAEVRRDIEKIQTKNGGVEDFDDEIVAVLRRDSGIQYIGNKLTQRFDLAIGVALRTKDGDDGMLAQGRSREGGAWDVMPFTIDEHSNLMLESAGSVTRKVSAATASEQSKSIADDHSPYGIL